MNLDQLRYLVDLANTGSMNTTAKNMYISQPAVSESIRRLEKELDCTLLQRTKTGVSFTREGNLVLESAKKMVREYEEMLANLRIRSQEQRIEAKYAICMGYSMEEMFFPHFLKEMNTAYPGILLQVIEKPVVHFLEQCEKGDFQIGLYEFMDNQEVYPEIIRKNYEVLTLYREPLVYVMASNHPLASESHVTEVEVMRYPATSMSYGYDEELTPNAVYVSPNIEMHRTYLLRQQAILSVPYIVYKQHFDTREYIAKHNTEFPWFQRCLLLPRKIAEEQPAGIPQLVKTALRFGLRINERVTQSFRQGENE